MRVIPAPGRHVRDPVTRRVIDQRGIPHRPLDFALLQLINHGDLEVVDDEAASPAAAPAAAEKE